jgi:hypothetical protein
VSATRVLAAAGVLTAATAAMLAGPAVSPASDDATADREPRTRCAVVHIHRRVHVHRRVYVHADGRRHMHRRRHVHRRRHCRELEPRRATPIPEPRPAVTEPVSTPTSPLTPAPVFPAYVGVMSREFSLSLSRPTVAPGEVIVQLANRGEDPHDLKAAPEDASEPVVDIAETPPGVVVAQQVRMEAGTWRLWCSMPGHEQLGMHVRLRVVAPTDGG